MHGNSQIFNLKHAKLLQKNLFDLGFTKKSLKAVSKHYPLGILDGFTEDPIVLILEMANKQEMLTYRPNNW